MRHEGIQELRKHKLIWTSWDDTRFLDSEDHRKFSGTDWGLRRIPGLNAKKLRLFILSLLWRATVTNLREFAEIVLPQRELEKLRVMVLNGQDKPVSFFPIQLAQLSTKGVKHNHTALAGDRTIPTLDGKPARTEPVFRFYFDGLVVLITRKSFDENIAKLGKLVLGNDDELWVTTIRYEGSRQQQIIGEMMHDTYSKWPYAWKLSD
jgi:hypothetical protein